MRLICVSSIFQFILALSCAQFNDKEKKLKNIILITNPNFHKNKTLGKPVDLNNSNALIGYKKYFINKNLNAIDDDIKYYFDKLNDNEKKIYQYENEQSGGSRKRNKTKKHKTKKRKTKHKTKKRKTKKRKTN